MTPRRRIDPICSKQITFSESSDSVKQVHGCLFIKILFVYDETFIIYIRYKEYVLDETFKL